MSPTYRKNQAAKRLARSLKGVAARARIRAERAFGEPIREWKLTRRITDEAVYRTRRVVEVWALDTGDGIRTRITENGDPISYRTAASALRALGSIP